MKVLYKIGFRLFLIVFILIVSNRIYSHYFFESDIQKHTYRDIVDVIPRESEIVYFGESSNFSVYFEDHDKRASNHAEFYSICTRCQGEYFSDCVVPLYLDEKDCAVLLSPCLHSRFDSALDFWCIEFFFCQRTLSYTFSVFEIVTVNGVGHTLLLVKDIEFRQSALSY